MRSRSFMLATWTMRFLRDVKRYLLDLSLCVLHWPLALFFFPSCSFQRPPEKGRGQEAALCHTARRQARPEEQCRCQHVRKLATQFFAMRWTLLECLESRPSAPLVSSGERDWVEETECSLLLLLSASSDLRARRMPDAPMTRDRKRISHLPRLAAQKYGGVT
jgi:hypothetical protein